MPKSKIVTQPVDIAKSLIPTKRENIRFAVQQNTPIPMKGEVLYLNRSVQKEEIVSGQIDIEREIQKLQNVIRKIRSKLGAETHGNDMVDIIEMVFEESLDIQKPYGIAGQIAKKIKSGVSCAHSFQTIKESLENKFKSNAMIAPGFIDVLNAFTVALSELSGAKTINQALVNVTGPTILFTETVIPSDFLAIKKHNAKHPDKPILGFVRRQGTPNDHIDVLCRQNKLCSAILKDHHFDYSKLKNHALALILSAEGLGESRDLIFNPDENILRQAEDEIQLDICLRSGLPIKEHPPYTKCGQKISLTYATSDLVAPQNRENENLDVGLLRTEMMIHDNGRLLTEDELFLLYKSFLGQKSPNIVTIRMPDLVGDKMLEGEVFDGMVCYQDRPEGREVLSGSQILLENPDILFRPHVRAVLRAVAEMKNGRILFPQVTNHQNAQELVDFVVAEKTSLGIPPEDQIQIGMMIEFYRTANDIEKMANVKGVNFFSIGSNDIIPDILGINRYDQNCQSHEYSMCHHDVIKALYSLMQNIDQINSQRSAKEGLIDISICGNMPSNPQFTPLLIGLGLTKFCVEGGVEVVNKMIAMLDVGECKKLVAEVLSHRMKKGEGIYVNFLKPFLKAQELPAHLENKLVRPS